MVNIPAKVKARLVTGVKRFQPILTKARDADINESDTVTVVADMLSEIFGYDKFFEVTSEFAIKRTYCDLAIKIDNKISLLIEVKAPGLGLKENFIRQAIDYSANSGVEWVILTNGLEWQVYRVMFTKPIDAELVYYFDITTINTRKDDDLELLFYLTREAMGKTSKASLDSYHQQKQLLNRTVIGQILISEPVLDAIRKTIRKMSGDAKVSNDEILEILVDGVIKRDILDSDKAGDAKKLVTKALRATKKKTEYE